MLFLACAFIFAWAALFLIFAPVLAYAGGNMVIHALIMASYGDIRDVPEDVECDSEGECTERMMTASADAQDCPVCLAHAEAPVSLV